MCVPSAGKKEACLGGEEAGPVESRLFLPLRSRRRGKRGEARRKPSVLQDGLVGLEDVLGDLRCAALQGKLQGGKEERG